MALGEGPQSEGGPKLFLLSHLAGLTAAFAAADVSALASQQRTELTSAIAVAAGAAWDRNNSWPPPTCPRS